jgi:LuxR family maltose regulon positive regulatory protein
MTTNCETVLQELDRGMAVPLTLVLTPDGCSTPLNLWLKRRSMPRARRALTAADNQPTRFLSVLTTILRPLLPPHEQMRRSPRSDLLDGIADLLNALLAVEDDFAVILEGYQAIGAPEVHAAVALMVDYPPPRMHLYVVSQTVPPLPLPRLRVRRRLVEIDLRRL